MRISDWSSDVCSSDLYWAPANAPDNPAIGVVLVNLGTPEAPTASAVRRYLAQFLHDWRVVDVSRWLWCLVLHGIILPLRSRRSIGNYAGGANEGPAAQKTGCGSRQDEHEGCRPRRPCS